MSGILDPMIFMTGPAIRAGFGEMAALGACLLWFSGLGMERILLVRARAKLKQVVHVNGTRGKSEATRLISAALRAGGVSCFAKTTGTEARLILPDGSERPLRRLGSANVREQRSLLFAAARAGAEAVVAECMAVSPDAQFASDAFLSPSILVITNVRDDHRLELGDRESTIRVFAAQIPAGGLVVLGDASLEPAFKDAAASAGAQLVIAKPGEEDIRYEGISSIAEAGAGFPENAALALAVARACGIPDSTAIAGMQRCTPDPGRFSIRRIPCAGRNGTAILLDALAANDPESTDILVARALRSFPGPYAEQVLLFSAREDRPDRSIAFAEHWSNLKSGAGGVAWDRIIVHGRIPHKAETLFRQRFKGTTAGGLQAFSRLVGDNLETLLQTLRPSALLCATGNWKKLGPGLSSIGSVARTTTHAPHTADEGTRRSGSTGDAS